jgi:hypothetical protein
MRGFLENDKPRQSRVGLLGVRERVTVQAVPPVQGVGGKIRGLQPHELPLREGVLLCVRGNLPKVRMCKPIQQ